MGHPVKNTVTYAALANGTIGHGDEVDATGQQGTGHFAPVMVATAISVGQYAKVSGKELIRALVLGSEVSARINSVMAEVFDHPRRHFGDCVGTIIGAAVLAGVLLKLNAAQMENAMALAASQASGLKAVYYDPTHHSKSLQCGIACQGGVVAALLSQRGFHGAPGILTVEHGFFDAFTGYASLGNQVVNDLGKTYLMSQIAYKRFPVGGPDQTPLYIFLQILKQHGLTADDIDQVEVTLSRGAFLTVATLKHPSVHMPTVLSLAAVFGESIACERLECRSRQRLSLRGQSRQRSRLPHDSLSSFPYLRVNACLSAPVSHLGRAVGTGQSATGSAGRRGE